VLLIAQLWHKLSFTNQDKERPIEYLAVIYFITVLVVFRAATDAGDLDGPFVVELGRRERGIGRGSARL
jgi:hypothetical protein